MVGRGKQPYFVTSADGKPLTLAGLREEWNGLLSITVITVPANEKVAAIHDRMPAILSLEEAAGVFAGNPVPIIPSSRMPLAAIRDLLF